MIDGTQFTFKTTNPNTHVLGLPCWEVLVNEKTNQKVNDIRTANIRGLDMKLKPSKSGGYNLIVNGSLHKYYNCGEHNADQFTFSKLMQSVDSITDLIGIEAKRCTIHGLEIGVNIELPYSPIRVLKNVISYRSKPFILINKRNARIGLQCVWSQYSIKLYDKAVQSGTDCGNVLRFEVSVDKMQVLAKYGVNTLADLQERTKIFPLINVLKDALTGIVWNDTTVNRNRLTDRELKRWLYYTNPLSWQAMGKFQRSRANKTWSILLSKYGNTPELFPFVLKTWEGLFSCQNEAENPQPFYHVQKKSEALKPATFLPLECTVKRLHHEPSVITFQNARNNDREIYNISDTRARKNKGLGKCCLTCGRNIGEQKRGSKFCSEKTFGKTAKKCRNKQSNKKRDIQVKLERAKKQNKFWIITYHNSNSERYSDMLHSSEIDIRKEWVNKIETINEFLPSVKN